jgi:hypothetical protein
MAEGRPAEDLQEAVAATLRRLRGEVGAARPAARVEPQFTAPPPPAAEELPPADEEFPPASPPEVPALEPARPDLLGGVASQTDIPPAPSSYEPASYETASYLPTLDAPELRAPRSHEAPPAASHDAPEMAEAAPPSRRHWLRHVAALVVLVAFAGVGWWAYRHFSGRASNGQIPVVAADQTPEKVPPADQPANQSQDRQETVYNQISPGGSTAQQPEVLLPQPEAPATPPSSSAGGATSGAAGSTAAGSNATGAGSSGAASNATSAAAAPAASDASPSSGSGTLTETLLPSSTGSNPPPAPPAAGASQGTASQAPAANQAPATQTATTAPSAPAATGTTESGQTDTGAAAPANDAPTAAGNYRVQLAALKTETDARAAWKRLAAKYPDVLGSMALHLEKIDLGTKGIYYRVQAGPFTDKIAARDVCAKLKAKGQQCLVKP